MMHMMVMMYVTKLNEYSGGDECRDACDDVHVDDDDDDNGDDNSGHDGGDVDDGDVGDHDDCDDADADHDVDGVR
jgi:hypothetical protein